MDVWVVVDHYEIGADAVVAVFDDPLAARAFVYGRAATRCRLPTPFVVGPLAVQKDTDAERVEP